ncbi:hypothetical protein J25TS5_47560 [Paenibacillus faecis]|uniref:hypothetical protein n=1 Tax=Paenibacillus faecis TaxID=862114 RepID=UPI001B11E45F|nr:hypothetical protein [Paenibacillus faecis]GIO87824.1 hypothetical protein J25TS5_47560 [Paenibacillus faecis]
MSTGIAIYDTEGITAREALDIGRSFFETIGVSVNSATYYRLLSDGDHEGDHDLFEVAPDRLKEMVLSGDCDAYWLYHERKGSVPWHAAFSRQTGEFGGFPHLTAFCEFSLEEVYAPLKTWLENLAKRFPRFSYAVVYSAKKMTDAYLYAAGNGGAAVYPFENRFAFNKETPGLYGGKGRYSGEMLRMVYLCNLVNRRHLEIDIGGGKLGEWIVSRREHGKLTELGNGFWLWEVETEQLDTVNRACGEAGILVAWKPAVPKKPKRKLP